MVPLTAMPSNPTTAPTSAPPGELAANITAATSTAAEFARYIHQALCSPPVTTLITALQKSTELRTIPGLTEALLRAHLPRSTTTDKGHMRRRCSNIASTRTNHADILAACLEVDQMAPPHEACAVHDVLCFAALANANTGTMYTDLTGAFPVRSFQNMKYIFVAYIYDINAIIVRPMPNRNEQSFITAFTDIFTVLQTRDYHPTLNVMDNECSQAVEKHIHNNNMNIQLVPPTTTMPMPPNLILPRSKSTSLPRSAPSTSFVPSNCGKSFSPKSNSPSIYFNPTISASEELYDAFDFTGHPLPHLVPKRSSLMISQLEPPGRRMLLTVSTLGWP